MKAMSNAMSLGLRLKMPAETETTPLTPTDGAVHMRKNRSQGGNTLQLMTSWRK